MINSLSNKKVIPIAIIAISVAVLLVGTLGVGAQNTVIEPGTTIADITGKQSIVISFSLPNIGGPDATIGPELTKQLIADKKEALVDSLSIAGLVEGVETANNIPILALTTNQAGLDILKNDSDVTAIQENKLNFTSLNTSVPQINADNVHAGGYTGSGQAVAILDTGSDSTHEFLNVISEACYSNSGGFGGGTSVCPGGVNASTAAGSGDDCVGIDGCDHGSHVAGIASGKKATIPTIDGVAPDSGIIAIQVFTEYSAAQCGQATSCLSASDFDIIRGLDRVLELQNSPGFTTNIASVNLSLGGGLYSNEATCDTDNSATKAAIDTLRAAGIATVIASGNDGNSSKISSPGCVSTAVAVGSVNDSSAISGFSNSNALVDLLAPGGSIYSSLPGNNYATFAGTSMATPHVAGAIALLREQFPSEDIDTLLAALVSEGTPVLDSRNGLSFPLINSEAAASSGALSPYAVIANLSSSYIGEDTSATLSLSLKSAPTGDVTIPLASSNTDELTVGTPSITITPATWNDASANQATINGVDDSTADGDQIVTIATGDPTSTDNNYDALEAADVNDFNARSSDTNWARSEVVFGDTDGDGKDEAHFIKYTGTGSGKIEIHTWNSDLKSWRSNIATNHNERPPSQARVVFGDSNGDGKDEAHFIKLNTNGSGKIEIHTWNVGYKSWKSNIATNHNERSPLEAHVQFADEDGDGLDSAYFIKYLRTGSGSVEIHEWQPGYKNWRRNLPTNHSLRPSSQVSVVFGDNNGNGDDEAFFVKHTNNGSNKIEIHQWADSYKSWAANTATNHSFRPTTQAQVGFRDDNGTTNAYFLKYIATGSGKVELHRWNSSFTDWQANYSTNQNQLSN